MTITGIGLALITEHLLHLIYSNRAVVNIIREGKECENLLLRTENGVLGYKMSGDASFLESYTAADTQLQVHLNNLSQLVPSSDNDQIKELRQVVGQWQNLTASWMKEGRYGASPHALSEGAQRKALMDSMQVKLDDFLHTPEQTFTKLRSEVDATKTDIWLGELGMILVVMLLTTLHIWRQMQNLAGSYEESLREVANQKEKFRVTLSSIGDAVIVTDVNGQTTFMNAEAERMTGWPWHEAKGKSLRNIFSIINEESRRTVDDPVEKVFKEKRVVGLANHTLLLSKSGAEWPIEDSAAPIYDADSAMIGVVLVFHDATEMRRAQRVLKTHAEELEQKVITRTVELQRTINELEAFSYTVSHDLRAPLRAMQGYSSALLEDFAEEWDGEAKELLVRIKNAAERLDVLIQDLLTYSKLNKEHQSIEPIDLNQLVIDILTQYPTFHSSGAKFEVQHPLDRVLGHSSGLTQVVSNLLTNSVKFVPPHRRPEIKIWTQPKEFTVRLWIEDNGIGIDPVNHERIFRMFEQVNSAQYDGTGMGLAIAKKAVETMQGRIGVESSLDNGTRIWVELLKARNHE